MPCSVFINLFYAHIIGRRQKILQKTLQNHKIFPLFLLNVCCTNWKVAFAKWSDAVEVFDWRKFSPDSPRESFQICSMLLVRAKQLFLAQEIVANSKLHFLTYVSTDLVLLHGHLHLHRSEMHNKPSQAVYYNQITAFTR